ncbi:class II aldolase/adducin family protein [Treponema parvum]|uniref:class II aldolase/adducin family protein n=1 Tax=Treponema parvum TaxID=138851 RepID=UPI002116FA00|nr:class II aldolase/adducin family protein [Treponema parvum]
MIETIEKYGYTVMVILGIIVKNHGPFSWGEDAVVSVYKAVVMEEVANMDFRTLMLNPENNMVQYVLDKHYFRKHGPKTYYGQ